MSRAVEIALFIAGGSLACGVLTLGVVFAVRAFVRWVSPRIRSHYEGRMIPWPLRWAMRPERPMLLIVGRRGKGKSAIAAKIALSRMRAGERVYANFDIWDERRGMVAGRVYSLLQCLDLRECTVVIDEANQWCNAREWSRIPSQVLSAWQQSRKDKLDFIFTSQHESRVEVVIRELVDFILVCERVPFIPKWVPLFRVQRTFLEEVEQVRAGKVFRAEYYWLKDDELGGYDTDEKIDGTMLEALAEYVKALKEGKSADEILLACPDRREPVFSGGVPPKSRAAGVTPQAAPQGPLGAAAAPTDYH